MAEREKRREKKEKMRVKVKVTGRELRPPDTSTLSSLLTLLNSISPTKLKTLILMFILLFIILHVVILLYSLFDFQVL